MDTVLITVTVLLTLGCVAFGWYLRFWYWSHRQPEEQVKGAKVCGVCHTALPKTAVRTHDGQWRCGLHKVQRV